MQCCSKCGQTFDVESCPFCGTLTQVPAGAGRENSKPLKKYALFTIAGMLGTILANSLYQPLDHPLKYAGSAMFLVSGCIYFWFYFIFKPMPWHLLFLKKMFAFVDAVLVLYTAFVILNGALDKYPLTQAETRVVRTYGGKGDRDVGFSIIVTPSWRVGRHQEEFQVVGDFNGHLQMGDLIRVEVHRGSFWLPWGATVTKRMR